MDTRICSVLHLCKERLRAWRSEQRALQRQFQKALSRLLPFWTLSLLSPVAESNSDAKLPTFSRCVKQKWKMCMGIIPHGPPDGSNSKESACNAGNVQKTCVPSLCQEDPLEEVMATQSSILAWRILWTEEHDGLQSTGLQRVRHN